MTFEITLDLMSILIIIFIPTAIIFFGAIALSVGGAIGDYVQSVSVERITRENERLLQENFKLREELGYKKP